MADRSFGKKFVAMLPFLVILAAGFYLAPYFTVETEYAQLVRATIIPVFCFVISALYGIKNSFNMVYPLLVLIIYAPSMFIFYAESILTILVAIVGAGIIALLGTVLGMVIHRTRN